MADHFLEVTGVKTKNDAVREARNSALQQRKNKVYAGEEIGPERAEFRSTLDRLLQEASERYAGLDQPISDSLHCAAINNISNLLSARFGNILHGGRMRYGTSQKALNLYLKFLWRLDLGRIAIPPHCPIDGRVLQAAGLTGSWTHCDSEEEYMGWINHIRRKAKGTSLSQWEYDIWLRETG